MNLRFFMFIALSFVFNIHTNAFAEETAAGPERIRIISLYAGGITDKYEDPSKGLSLKDSGAIYGLYAQWIETNLFQGNIFAYWSPDVNYSKVFGIHGNFDGYFLNSNFGALVAGIDIEDININMNAGSHIAGLDDFKLKNNVLFSMLRVGYKFKLPMSPSFTMSLFPYIGITNERVTGELTVDPAGPPAATPGTTSNIYDNENYFSWGTNLNIKAFHFIELTLKYLGRNTKQNYLNSVTAQADFYVTHHIILSYQFKKMELSSGYDLYHLFGVGMVF